MTASAWRLVLAGLWSGVLALSCAGASHAGCASAVVIEDRYLFGTYVAGKDATLPESGKRVSAISPACNDTTDANESDTETTVYELRGVPREYALISPDREELYLAVGSLVALAAHPLHLVYFPNPREPSYIAGRACRAQRKPLLGRAIEPVPHRSLRLATSGGVRTVMLDASTRLINRSITTPINPGQRLEVKVTRCGTRRVARTISFVGPDAKPLPFQPSHGNLARWLPRIFWLLVIAVPLGFAVWSQLRRSGRVV